PRGGSRLGFGRLRVAVGGGRLGFEVIGFVIGGLVTADAGRGILAFGYAYGPPVAIRRRPAVVATGQRRVRRRSGLGLRRFLGRGRATEQQRSEQHRGKQLQTDGVHRADRSASIGLPSRRRTVTMGTCISLSRSWC